MNKNNLKKLRKEKKLSQRELSIQVNISQSMISNLERGATKLDVETIRMFAKFYETTTDEIIGVEKEPLLEIAEVEILRLPQPVKDSMLLKLIKRISNKK